MIRKWLLPAIGFFAVIVFPVLWYIQAEISGKQMPHAVEGWMDLREKDLTSKKTFALVGEWEFYRNRLLIPEDFAKAEEADELLVPDAIVKVPGDWNNYVSPKGKRIGTGYGTFRLRIDLGANSDGIYSIKTTSIRMANRIFLNGEQVGNSGVPATQYSERREYNVPYVGYGEVRGGVAEILVQVSNYDYSRGGIIYPMVFGNPEAVQHNRESALFGDYLSIVGFSLFTLFFLLIYQVRRQERSLLYLGLFCLCSLIYILVHGEKLLFSFFPELPYNATVQFQAIFTVLVFYFLLRYVDESVPGAISRSYIKFCLVLMLIIIFITAVFSTGITSWLYPGLLIASSSIIYGLFRVSYVAIRRRDESAPLMLFNIMNIVAMIVTGVMTELAMLENQLMVVYNIIVFVIVQIGTLAYRFATTFRQVEQLSEKLLTLDGLKDEFLANTSHELRTPLHGMVNIAESLLEGVAGKPNDRQAHQLSMIVTTGKRLSYLINDILDFAKLKNGDMILNRQAVDLPATAQSVLEVIGHLAVRKGNKLLQHWPDQLPLLHADEDRLRQILYNLLGNAVKFTSHGEIRITAEVRGSYVRVTVSDTGVGIAADRLRNVFKPYHSVDPGLLPDYSGTGIGLSITKKLVELGGGTIGVQSYPGQGSLFWFTVPVAAVAVIQDSAMPRRSAVPVMNEVAATATSLERPPVQGQAASQPANGSAQHFRIMVVDDDLVNLQVLINLLSMEHYTVIAVQSGGEALQRLEGVHHIDLVITDWMMPGMSGLELCRAIRQRHTMSELPVLMLTARSLADDVQAGLGAGANDFLSKPVDAGVLRARVRTLLELRRSMQLAIESELAFLQAQIKPHFLYNALNTIISICYTDANKAIELLLDLSRYLRSCFDFQNRLQMVPIEKELELVRSYAALEQARFGRRLQIIYEIDGGLQGTVPPLTIQPLVENAVRHGVMQRPEGGTIVLSIARDGKGNLAVVVTDDGVGISDERKQHLLDTAETREGVGLINIHRRLLSLYGNGVEISSALDGGTKISFTVPQAAI